MYLRQTKYKKDIMKFNMEIVSAYPTPMVTSRKFTTKGEPMINATLYGQTIGTLQYLTNSRPYIAFTVNKLRKYMSITTMDHSQRIKRILRYLQGTMNLCLHIKPSNDLNIIGYLHADWTTNIDDKIHGKPVCISRRKSCFLSSRKQKVVS
ncbi:hypothetical protein V8G54_005136 [Vigna mungo]|uniref:Reverse transcriptase Ty1/copia-type domain-containing protein n=1 Tax=Vigna mungo TaxID=3915 RepID=A0AAQ3PFD6_VIGMU